MARTFRRPRQSHPISELNVTNLIDLAFTLLIIFMIATPLIQQEQTIPVNLPTESTKTQQKPPPDTEFQSISIDKSGSYFVGAKRVTFGELTSTLATFAAKPKQPVIRIRADLTLQWQQVARLMDEITKQKLSKIQFDTQTSK